MGYKPSTYPFITLLIPPHNITTNSLKVQISWVNELYNVVVCSWSAFFLTKGNLKFDCVLIDKCIGSILIVIMVF